MEEYINIKEFADTLDGKEYSGYYFLSDYEKAIAKENGFVVVTGASDDLIEFEGAIEDEGSCYEGGETYCKGIVFDLGELH